MTVWRHHRTKGPESSMAIFWHHSGTYCFFSEPVLHTLPHWQRARHARAGNRSTRGRSTSAQTTQGHPVCTESLIKPNQVSQGGWLVVEDIKIKDAEIKD